MVKRIFNQHRHVECDISYPQFKHEVKCAIDELLAQHNCSSRDREFFKKQGDSLCKRLYSRVGPLIQQAVEKRTRS